MEPLRERIEARASAVEAERLRCWLDPAEASRLEDLDDRFGDLSSGESLEALRAERDAARFEAARDAATRLLTAVEDCVVAARTRPLVLALDRASGVGDGEPPARAGEASEIARELFQQRAAARSALGYPDGLAWAARRFDPEPARWLGECERLLEASESSYGDAFARERARLRATSVDPELQDLVEARRLAGLDALFPPDRIADALRPLLEGFRIDLDRVVAQSAGPRAPSGIRCFPLDVPRDVRVVRGQLLGYQGHLLGLGAFGRALHAAFTASDLPVERRRLGDPTLPGLFAVFLESRLADPAWLSVLPAGRREAELADGARFFRLAALRECAALARVDLELAALPAGSDPSHLVESFADSRARALGVRRSADLASPDWLVHVSGDLEWLVRLRALALEAKLSEALRARFGRTYWQAKGAGDLLKELWHTGTTFDAEALAAELDLGELEVSELVSEVS